MKGQNCDHSPIERWASQRIAYSLAAGAAVSGVAGDADAGVVYSGIEDISIAQGYAYPLRLDEDEYNDVLLRNFVFGGDNYQGARLPFRPGRFVAVSPTPPTNIAYPSALGPGFLVNASSVNESVWEGTLAFENHNPSAQFNNIQNAYLGFRFAKFPNLDDTEQRDPHYGWARISIDNVAGTFMLHDWAYETEVGVGILTGDKGDAGDFNDDGTVDAADYTVWRDNLGSDHILGGHGDENFVSFGVVDANDYTIWKANFGHVSAGSGAAANAVPEPTALGLLAAGSLGVLALRRRYQG
jgi:hypothetical protein